MGDKASRMVHMSVRMVRKGDKMVRKSAGSVKQKKWVLYGVGCR
jgi:hypothetical protein